MALCSSMLIGALSYFLLFVVESGVSMELRCLGQTSGFRGCEPWVNFKLLPPSRRERGREEGQEAPPA